MSVLSEEQASRLPEVIFFSVGSGTGLYPTCEPFYTWLSSLLQPIFHDKEWLAKQDITVVEEKAENHLPIFYISASREWFLRECPCLLEPEFRKYLFEPDWWAGYTEPEGFQKLSDETRGRLYRIVNGEFVE